MHLASKLRLGNNLSNSCLHYGGMTNGILIHQSIETILDYQRLLFIVFIPVEIAATLITRNALESFF